MKQTHASDMIATIIVMQANKRCHNLIIARVQLIRHIFYVLHAAMMSPFVEPAPKAAARRRYIIRKCMSDARSAASAKERKSKCEVI
jgi:hypothetical protein